MYLQLEENNLSAKGRIKAQRKIRIKPAPQAFKNIDELKIKKMSIQLEENNIFLGRNKDKPKKKLFKGKGKNLVKKVLLAPGRALFIAMNQINFGQIATKLSKGNQDKLKEQWLKLGGDYNKLVKAINKGKNKKAKGNDFFKKILGKKPLSEHENNLGEELYLNDNFGLCEDEEENPAGLSKEAKAKIIAISTGAAGTIGTAVGLPAVAAAGPALAAVIIGIIPLLSKADEIPDAENPTGPEVPTDPNQEPDEAAAADADSPEATAAAAGTPGAAIKKIFSKKNLPFIIGGAAVLGIGAFFLLKKKK
jgi:LPXTG-motif cell wall-anchored protein